MLLNKLSYWAKLKGIFGEPINILRRLKAEMESIRHEVSQNSKLVGIMEERSRSVEHEVSQNSKLVSLMEERSRSVEHEVSQNSKLVGITKEIARTIEYVSNQNLFAAQYQIDFAQKFYLELMPRILELDNNILFNARQVTVLETDFPFAYASNDYITPESTVEGVVRPTFFVRHCIDLLGQEIKCLDLGTGAAGLIFEYAMNGVLAIGVEGADFCARYNIGYWPLLRNNLFHCDITKPFNFISVQSKSVFCFDIITMWEVLEHIEDEALDSLFRNIVNHLRLNGYFIGSVSLLEYADKNGQPYHVTLKPREWWRERFLKNGLTILETHPFNEEFFCRGVGSRFQDIHNYFLHPEEGFHFVAKKSS